MMRKTAAATLLAVLIFCAPACRRSEKQQAPKLASPSPEIRKRLDKFTSVDLVTDVSSFTSSEKQVLVHLIRAAQVMDNLFWIQAYGDKLVLFKSAPDPQTLNLLRIHYGPWDRLDNDQPFLPGAGQKPLGANFYPQDMSRAEFEETIRKDPGLAAAFRSPYTRIERDQDGKLIARPYHQVYKPLLAIAVRELQTAAKLTPDPIFRRYLELRANALLTDDYRASDLAWFDLKNSRIDAVIGPIETYEDRLLGYKAAYEACILVKDLDWSRRLARYERLLPALQRELPVPAAYKKEQPGAAGEIGVYEAVYFAGDCNAGSKTIAINLPNDEEIQLAKGSKRLQLKNVMQAKFEKIALPVGRELIAHHQQKHLRFEAFFVNTLFHEVAHGLGVKHTITGKGPVRQALAQHHQAIEEAKADILGLYLVRKLNEKGELADLSLEDSAVTFVAGIFRSLRFGGSSAHGVAARLHWNFLEEEGAVRRDPDGTYLVVFEKFAPAVEELARQILKLQGDGDPAAVESFLRKYGAMGDGLRRDLDRLSAKAIPVDVVFRQGIEVLGLTE